ncbi:hypothetical protein [Geitlerinema calcuttense]|uniref:Uncharacterized protein n=1 Tax=Geitlerinema calcuttense NRMC-F 0142 TaxID=2922238 RepID=A0ABT7LYU9_9CYAN|nr:hypothetical protein [Geitlerinema calcuttense]MDL5057192.1 hypothetical protein [Geitlerinema calcuttense NRMC-F 0142]
MNLLLFLGVQLRLFMGCQAWILWQPDNSTFATVPYRHQQQRKKRSC